MDAAPKPSAQERTYPLARVMFWVAFAHLLIVAGVVHRANQPEVTRGELALMLTGLFVLWRFIAAEAWVAYFIRDRSVRPQRSTRARTIWITLLPPLRMGLPCPFTGRLWLPVWGWCERGADLEERLERAFHKP